MGHPFQGAHRYVAGGDAPQGSGQLRLSSLQVATIVDDESVAAEEIGIGGDERLQVAAGLLFALNEDFYPDGRLAAEEAEGGRDDHDARLVVGGATAVHA